MSLQVMPVQLHADVSVVTQSESGSGELESMIIPFLNAMRTATSVVVMELAKMKFSGCCMQSSERVQMKAVNRSIS